MNTKNNLVNGLIDRNGLFTRDGLTYLAMQQAAILFGNGAICVMRESNGKPAVLRIENQKSFKEWAGCFSIIHGC